MKTLARFFDFMQKLVGVAILGLVIAACGSNTSMAQSAGSFTVDQLDALLAKSPTFSALAAKVGVNSDDIATFNGKLAADEKLLAQVALIGHAPGKSITARVGKKVMSYRREDGSIGFATVAADVSFGPCDNMGTLIGFSSPNPAAATVAFFKTCMGYWYGVNILDGTIFQPQFLWFTDSTCGADGGDPIMLAEGGVNRLAGAAGFGFMSPVDGTTEYAIPQSSSASTMTSGSAFVANNGCTVDVETQPGYTLVPNATTTTGVPVAGPSDFTL